MSPVLVGCILDRLGTADAGEWRRVVTSVEAAGLDHLAVGDHVSFRTGAGSDGLLSAATILGISERLATNTAVYLLPLRHPVLVARQLADIAGRAPGRFVFGVGIGGEDRREVKICGVDPRTRGRRMDECLQVIRALLTGKPIDFAGEFFCLDEAQIAEAPATPVPIVVGGRSEAAVRRAGHYGDGWFGIWVSSKRYAQAVDLMREVAHGAGRGSVNWCNALNVWCGVDDTEDAARGHVARAMEVFYGLPYDTFERWSPAGPPRRVAEFLIPYASAGCRVFNLIINGRDAEAEIDAAAEIRELLVDATGQIPAV